MNPSPAWRIVVVLRLAVGILPAGRYKNRLLRRLGYSIAKSATISPVLIWRVDRLRVEEYSRIGPGNVFRDLASVTLEEHAVLGQWNWISASMELRQGGGSGAIHIGRHSAVTSRHYLDASGGISIGDFTTLAGVRTTVITHGINWRRNVQLTKGVQIGNHCLIGSNAVIPPGTVVPDRVVTAMGSTLAKGVVSDSLVMNARAEQVGHVDGAYFNRQQGFVSPERPGQGASLPHDGGPRSPDHRSEG